MLRRNVSQPWFGMIKSGDKTFEGRTANKIKDWDLFVGKIIIFFCDSEELTVEITSLPTYSSFEEAFDYLGYNLVPVKGITREEVGKMYSDLPIDDPKVYGVVAIEFKIIWPTDECQLHPCPADWCQLAPIF